jgi:hypothetical protein
MYTRIQSQVIKLAVDELLLFAQYGWNSTRVCLQLRSLRHRPICPHRCPGLRRQARATLADLQARAEADKTCKLWLKLENEMWLLRAIIDYFDRRADHHAGPGGATMVQAYNDEQLVEYYRDQDGHRPKTNAPEPRYKSIGTQATFDAQAAQGPQGQA